jgi:ferredoxin-NADP reductase
MNDAHSIENTGPITVFVHTLRYEAIDIISVDLRRKDGGQLPAFTAGAHIDLQLPNGMVRSYSLLNDPQETHRYVLGILKDKSSRGGSRCVHEQLRVGTELTISEPRNHFALDESAPHSVLIAGGIGITPLLAMARRLSALGRSFEVHLLARARPNAAFIEEMQAQGGPVHLRFDVEQGGPPDLKALMSSTMSKAGDSARHWHFYACGPAVMLDAFEKSCTELGLTHGHLERFAAVEQAASDQARGDYTVVLNRSGKTIPVRSGFSLLQALKDANVAVSTSCEEGICGSCEVKVLEGEPDHRDSVLSASERKANKAMMVCVSGCKSERLVLDL